MTNGSHISVACRTENMERGKLFLLYHFSEDPSIENFTPRVNGSHPYLPPLVWAIDHEHAPLYYFPRDCPRVAFWKRSDSSDEDISRFCAFTTARMVIVVEGGWLGRINNTKLYVYEFENNGFDWFDTGAGYYVSKETVVPLSVNAVGNLMERLIQADVELRITPSLNPLHDALVSSSLQFSMIRMRNAVR